MVLTYLRGGGEDMDWVAHFQPNKITRSPFKSHLFQSDNSWSQDTAWHPSNRPTYQTCLNLLNPVSTQELIFQSVWYHVNTLQDPNTELVSSFIVYKKTRLYRNTLCTAILIFSRSSHDDSGSSQMFDSYTPCASGATVNVPSSTTEVCTKHCVLVLSY